MDFSFLDYVSCLLFLVGLTPDEELWHLDFSRKFKFLGLAGFTDRRCNVRCPCGVEVSFLHTPYFQAPLGRDR